MPLIKCPDCGKDVSDRADHCIGCGAPLNSASSRTKLPYTSTIEDSPVEIEATHRGYKNQMILGVVLVAAGLLAWLVANSAGLGALLILSGAVLYASAKFGAWYRNG